MFSMFPALFFLDTSQKDNNQSKIVDNDNILQVASLTCRC